MKIFDSYCWQNLDVVILTKFFDTCFYKHIALSRVEIYIRHYLKNIPINILQPVSKHLCYFKTYCCYLKINYYCWYFLIVRIYTSNHEGFYVIIWHTKIPISEIKLIRHILQIFDNKTVEFQQTTIYEWKSVYGFFYLLSRKSEVIASALGSIPYYDYDLSLGRRYGVCYVIQCFNQDIYLN